MRFGFDNLCWEMEPLADERDDAETCRRGPSFFGRYKTSILFNSPEEGMSPTGVPLGEMLLVAPGRPWRDRTGMP